MFKKVHHHYVTAIILIKQDYHGPTTTQIMST